MWYRIVVLCSMCVSMCYGQVVRGRIVGMDGMPLPGVRVKLLQVSDSSLRGSATSDSVGIFAIQAVWDSTKWLRCEMLGMKPANVWYSSGGNKMLRISMETQVVELGTVEVHTQGLAVKLRGDTTEMDAQQYKVNKDATGEDLVTKMPGVQVQDGKVQAQGEEVKQVMVDGKPFFGDDPNAVLKNIPAEVIERIQVFDRRSDQSQFTGFDDGNSSKTINVITRPQFRNGTFGRLYAGYGTNARYKSGGVLNKFKEQRRITVLGQSNNISEQNFSQEDLSGVLSSGGGMRGGMGSMGGGPRGGGGGPRGMGGMGRGGMGGNDGSQFVVDPRNGITTTHAAAINYTDKWHMKTDVAMSYFFNYGDNKNNSQTLRTYLSTVQAGNVYQEINTGAQQNATHRLNMRMEHKWDSLHALTVQPRITYQLPRSTSTTIGVNSRVAKVTSNTWNEIENTQQAYNGSMMVMYRQGFDKRGRTFTVTVTPSMSGGDGTATQLSENYATLVDTVIRKFINQQTLNTKQGWNIWGNITYTEPIDTNHSIYLGYGYNSQLNDVVRETYNYIIPAGAYIMPVPELSNSFRNDYSAHSPEAGYRYQRGAHNVSVGAAAQLATLHNATTMPTQNEVSGKYMDVLPNAMWSYRWSTRKNIRAHYRTSANVPTAEQLQPVLNNSNPLFLTSGNINLTQDMQHNVMVRFSNIDVLHNRSMFWLGGFTVVDNYITNEVIDNNKDSSGTGGAVLPPGAQLLRPINADGYYSVRTFFSYGFPAKFLRSNVNLNTGVTYSRTPAIRNRVKSYTSAPALNAGIVLSSNISDKIDFTVSSTTSLTASRNSIDTRLNQDSWRQVSRARINVTLLEKLVLMCEATHNYNTGLAEGFNREYMLMNAAAGYKFLKNKVAELRVSAFDILNQNRNVQRIVSETYFEDTSTNALRQYFMLTFSYKISPRQSATK